MEYALPNLLTREQILIILDGRGIQLPDIESLPLESLLRIYKAFAVPLAKRESAQSRRNNTNTNGSTPVQIPPQIDIDVEMRTDVSPELPGGQKKRFKRIENATNIPVKRPHSKGGPNPQTDDQFLSTATKRIKITWP